MDYTISGKGEGDSGISITGTATIVGDNETMLNLQVEVEGSTRAGVGGGEASAEAKESSRPLFNVQLNRYCHNLKESSIYSTTMNVFRVFFYKDLSNQGN